MFCYCRHILWSELGSGNDPWEALSALFSDGEAHCKDWFAQFTISKTLLLSVPVAILFVNWISKTILRIMTRFEGYQSKPEEVYASTVNMFIMTFINAGLTIQLVYFKWIPGINLPFLLNKYDSFSQEWY